MFLESLKDVSPVLVSALSTVILALCAVIIFLISNNEAKHARQHWNRISGFMELAEQNVSYPLICDEILIGRHASADIRLTDLSVSRYHAILTVADGVWTITDIGSKSGIFVNGTLVKQRVLYENDVINLGNRKLIFRHRRVENVR
ncbi:MAG: FHA domain-containing protein [Ruminococcus sp.]|nr:FHA domain-containing protein [Ruminococcus sp.]MDE6500567.1 FHA domain-containing protein [Ruminococcus sp.]MDE6677590.1 FHA domain-containing protein [Ruminococcus sp.]